MRKRKKVAAKRNLAECTAAERFEALRRLELERVQGGVVAAVDDTTGREGGDISVSIRPVLRW